jgi:hypothetical protein
MKANRILAAVIAAALLAALVPAAAPAGTLPSDIVAMFPKEIGELAYADLRAARRLSWFPQLKSQMIPQRFQQFEAFLAAAGIDINSQVNELAWGLVAPGAEAGEQIVGVALGQFNPATTENYFRQQQLPTKELRGYRLYAFGSGEGPLDPFFFFLDSNTAAFGHRQLIEQFIEVRYGAAEGLLRNEPLYRLVDEVNGSGTVWAALDRTYTRLALRQLAPESQQFAEAERLAAKLNAMTISIQADRGLDARFATLCETTEDANLLANLLQAGLLYRRYQAEQSSPDLVRLLDSTRITPRGDRIEVRIDLGEDLVQALLRQNIFVLRM